MAGDQRGKSRAGGLAHQVWRGADGRHRTGLRRHEGPLRLLPGLGLEPDPGLVAMVLEVLGIPLPAGAAVNATAVHVERSARVFRAALSGRGHGGTGNWYDSTHTHTDFGLEGGRFSVRPWALPHVRGHPMGTIESGAHGPPEGRNARPEGGEDVKAHGVGAVQCRKRLLKLWSREIHQAPLP